MLFYWIRIIKEKCYGKDLLSHFIKWNQRNLTPLTWCNALKQGFMVLVTCLQMRRNEILVTDVCCVNQRFPTPLGTGLHGKRWVVGEQVKPHLPCSPSPIRAILPSSASCQISGGSWILIGVRTYCELAHASDLGCASLMKVIQKPFSSSSLTLLPPPIHGKIPWNQSLVPQYLGITGISHHLTWEQLWDLCVLRYPLRGGQSGKRAGSCPMEWTLPLWTPVQSNWMVSNLGSCFFFM